jgi:hypothetical protein
MSGINTGILINAKPLSTERIKELEKQVLEKQETFAYLDENSDLCFSMPRGVDNIKDLAWNNAYELSTEANSFTKKAYKKTGLKTFYLDKVLSKQNINDAWGEPERLEGDGQEFYTMAPSTLSFRSTAPLNELQDVQINGQTVDPSNYELEEGSTIVKLKHDYLSTLGVGQYELSVVSNSKTVKGDFTVAAPELNEHGFYYNQPYAVSLSGYAEDYEEEINQIISIFSINSDDTVIRFDVSNGERLSAVFEHDGKHFRLQFEMYEFTGEFSADGNMTVETASIMGEPVDGISVTIKVDTSCACADSYYHYIRLNGNGEEWIVTPKSSSEQTYPLIQATIMDMPVTFLADLAFANNRHITSLDMIPESISTFGSYAFSNCSSITTLHIPDHVNDLFGGCFHGCTSLRSISLPVNLIIDDYIFSGCNNLQEITYRGTKADCEQLLENHFNGIASHIFLEVPATYIQCSDGQVAL